MSAYETLLCATARAQDSKTGTLSVATLDLAEVLAELAALRGAGPAASKYPAEFEEAWSLYPARPGASKAATLKAWKARVKAGASVVQMLEGTVKYAAYCKAKGTEPEYIKQPATFYGPGEHYAADWSVRSQVAVSGAAKNDLIAEAMRIRRGAGPSNDLFMGVTIDV